MNLDLEFGATDGGVDEEEDHLVWFVTGADSAGEKHYLTLQRDLENEGRSRDWGVYVEFDDQSNGRYHGVQCCRATRTSIRVEFMEPIDLLKKYAAIVVNLARLDEGARSELRDGLSQVFRGWTEILQIA